MGANFQTENVAKLFEYILAYFDLLFLTGFGRFKKYIHAGIY